MRPVIDDFPVVLASTLRANGSIGPGDKTAVIRFGDSDVEFVVGVVTRRMKAGDWSLFLCPCGKRCQKLRLFRDAPACAGCIRAAGFRYRTEMVSRASKRAALTEPGRIAKLNAGMSLRVRPLPGRKLERRRSLELKVARARIVERQAGHEFYEKALKKL